MNRTRIFTRTVNDTTYFQSVPYLYAQMAAYAALLIPVLVVALLVKALLG